LWWGWNAEGIMKILINILFMLLLLQSLHPIIGCGGNPFMPDNTFTVGPYKYPSQPDYILDETKYMGHHRHNTGDYSDELESYCAICHWTF